MLEVVYLASVLCCALIALVSWRRREATTAAGALCVAMLGLTWWSTVDLLSMLTEDRGVRSTVVLAIYPGVGAVVAGFWCLCRALADHDWVLRPRTALLLAVEPVLISVAAGTNQLHELVLVPAATADAPIAFGPVFWAHTAYSYALLGTALVRVLRERASAPALQTRQLTTVLVAAGLPTIGNVLTIGVGLSRYDLTALFFVGTGLLSAYAVFRQGLFSVVPVARARVLERLEAAVLVLDEQDRLGDVNSSAQQLLARALPPGSPALGTPWRTALGGLASALGGDGGEQRVRLVDGEADLDVKVTPLFDRKGRRLGRVVVAHDVSEAMRARRLLAEANATLNGQLATIERLRGELAELAARDPLTGLHNRRHLTAVLDDLVRLHAATGAPLSVVLLDVDHFKAVNDGHGHAVGDRLLQALGECLRTAVRPGDTVARYGGEEFVVVLPGADTAQALARTERLRALWALVVVDGRGAAAVSTTFSAGVATLGPGVPDVDALLERADEALYRAKAAGRDRVCCDQPPLVALPTR